MAGTRNAAQKLDWSKLSTSLSLRGTTASSLAAFKSRHDNARRRVQMLSEQPQSVDFAQYRSILKNQAVVDDIEKQVSSYQIKKYDVSRQIKAIESFEAKAVEQAQETKGMVEKELKDLDKTLKNIQDARPVDELTVDDVMTAEPKVEERARKLVSGHRWVPAGYKEKFGDLSVL